VVQHARDGLSAKHSGYRKKLYYYERCAKIANKLNLQSNESRIAMNKEQEKKEKHTATTHHKTETV